MSDIINFESVPKDTHQPFSSRTDEENVALRKMIKNVATAWLYPSNESIQVAIKATEAYCLRVVDILRISPDEIPAAFVTSNEEMYEDISEHFEVLKKYILSPDSIGFSKNDFEIWKRILLTHKWLVQYDFRSLQDPYLYDAIESFTKNIWPIILTKLGNKLWILDDISEWSSLEERVLYELDREMSKNKRATS